MKDMGINVKYNIYGSGPELGFLLYIINSVNLQDDVSIHDHVNQVELLDAYNNAHVFLLSSTVEGVSNAALEAAATGLPIVSTKLEGMNELFAHQESVYFTDSVESDDLLAGLLYVYNNPEFAKNIGIRANIIVREKLTLQSQIDNFVKLYQDLI
jgi:glycosyltransferase involved in cell wall biosynthesis